MFDVPCFVRVISRCHAINLIFLDGPPCQYFSCRLVHVYKRLLKTFVLTLCGFNLIRLLAYISTFSRNHILIGSKSGKACIQIHLFAIFFLQGSKVFITIRIWNRISIFKPLLDRALLPLTWLCLTVRDASYCLARCIKSTHVSRCSM